MFLLNSRLGRLSATDQSLRREVANPNRHPFFRSYGIIMPSSLTRFHSFTLGYSPCPPVSVYGTVICSIPHQSFSCQSTLRDLRLGCPAHSSQVSVALHPFTAIHKAVHASFLGPSGVANTLQTGPEYSPAIHRLRLWGLALGSASPCADCHGAGILGLTVCGVLTRICAYSIRHPLF